MASKMKGCLGGCGVLVLVIAVFIGVEDYGRRRYHLQICHKLKLGEEHVPETEARDLQAVVDTLDPFMSRRLNGTLDDPQPDGLAKRVQHPIAWGCFPGQLTVRSDLPTHLQVGLFREPGATFSVSIRTAHSGFDPDYEPKGASIAMKVKLSGPVKSEPRLNIDDYPTELKSLNQDVQDLIFASTDRAAFSHPSTGVIDMLALHEAQMRGGVNAILMKLLQRPTMFLSALSDVTKGAKITVPFLAPLTTIHALRMGNASTAAKFLLKPCADNKIKEMPPAPAGQKFFIARMQQEYINEHGVCMDLFVQRQVDSCKTSIEDLTIQWDEREAMLEPVARLSVPKGMQTDHSCEFTTFNPWYGLAAHQPVGYIGRMRREIYKVGAMLRMKKSAACPFFKE